MHRPSIIAHRGASGDQFENSFAAFRRAVQLDVDGIELDVHATRDGAIVVHHDAELDGAGAIGRLTLADVKAVRLRNGEPVPCLDEVLALIGSRDVWVEIKTLPEAADQTLLAILAEGPAPARYAVHSFDHRVIRRLGDRQPDLRRGILLSSYLIDPVTAMRAAGATTLWQAWSQIDEQLIELVHRAGGAVIGWTVNEIEGARRLAQFGVDGLCGNYPDRLRIALAGQRHGTTPR